MKWIIAFLLSFSAFSQTQTQSPPEKTIRVAYHEFKPCIFKRQDGTLAGYEYDLLELMAKRNNWSLQWKRASSFEAVFEAVETGNADIASAGITINSERARKYAFGYPHMENGLRLMIAHKSDRWKESLYYLQYVVSNIAIYTFLGFIVFFGHIVWVSERGQDAFNDAYFPGIFEAMYFCLITISTVGYGDYAPKRWQGRIVVSFLIVGGIIFFGWFATQVTSFPDYTPKVPTEAKLTSLQISTKRGTTSEDWLRKRELSADLNGTIEECYLKLLTEETDAVLFDSPSILHFVKTKGKGRVLYGDLYNNEHCGFLLKKGDSLKNEIDNAILDFQEQGVLKSCKKKWLK